MNKPLAFTFIIVTLTIDAMGIGLIIPVMPDLLQNIEGGDLGHAAILGGDFVHDLRLDAISFWSHHRLAQ